MAQSAASKFGIPRVHWLPSTRNPWIWAALALCAGILVTAAYVPSLSQMLHLVTPDIEMCGIVLAMSLAPLIA